MKIYTKTGDKGETSLFNGQRVAKYNLRVETYGTVDELNSVIGIVRSFKLSDKLNGDLKAISNLLFVLGTDLATPMEPAPKFDVNRISEDNVLWLEELIDNYTEQMPALNSFILPGGSHHAAFLHLARTVCRRAERLAIRLSETEKIKENTLIFLNRLSDYLFTASRFANHNQGVQDIKWEKSIT